MLTAKNLLIDFNSIACYFGVPIDKGASNEHRQNYLKHNLFIMDYDHLFKLNLNTKAV